MRNRKSWFLIIMSLLFILCTTVLLVSINQSYTLQKDEDYTQFDNEQKKIRFISSWGGFDTKAEILEKTLEAFMDKYPNIEVVNESMSGSDFLFKLKKDFASGNDPDVFCIWPGSDIKVLINEGKVADLTDILENDKQWKDSFYSVRWSPTTVENRIYGLPVEVIFEALFCNMDLFEKYDIKRPANFEELKEAALKFKEVGVIPIAYNAEAEGSYLYQNIIAGIGSAEEVEIPIKQRKVGQCYIEAMKYVKELYRIGAFPHNTFSLSNYERDSLFINKKAAMIVQGSWFIGNFDKEDRTVEIVPFPRIKPDEKYPKMVYGLGAGVYYMSSNAAQDEAKKSASITLMKYLTGEEAIMNFVKSTGMISNVSTDRSKSGYNRLAERGILMVNYSFERHSPPDHFVNRSIWDDIIVKKFPYYLESKISAEELWEEATDKHYEIFRND